jgi:colanic acid/amylovoran biosynthesis glycosyltransferase
VADATTARSVLRGKTLLVVGIKWPAETFLQRKLRGLAAAGLKVVVAALTGDPRPRFTDGELTIVKLPSSDDPPLPAVSRFARSLPGALRDPLARRRLWEVAGEQGRAAAKALELRRAAVLGPLVPDLVHFEWNADAVTYWPYARLWDCPVTISCRGTQMIVSPHEARRAAYRAGLVRTLGEACLLHCVSDAMRQVAVELGAPEERTRVISPAVDTEVFSPGPRQLRDVGDPLRMVAVGGFVWLKGLEWTLHAVAKLRATGVDARLTLVGDGPEKQRVLATIFDLGLTDVVELTGKLPPDRVLERLRAADAFVLSSFAEGIANVVLEAMAVGVPTVSTDCGGMAEVIRHGVDGLLVPVRDAAATAHALASLAADPAYAQRLGLAGRERIVERFRLDQQIDHFLAFYAEALDNKKAVAA